MSKINRPPLGLQSLLGSQNFGDNPSDLRNSVQPTIEMFPFLASGQLKTKEETGGRVNEGEIVSVDFDHRYALQGVSLQMKGGLTVGNETVAVGFALDGLHDVGGAFEPYYFYTSDMDAWLLGNRIAYSYFFPQPLIVEPNTSVAAWYLRAALGNADLMHLKVLYYDLSD